MRRLVAFGMAALVGSLAGCGGDDGGVAAVRSATAATGVPESGPPGETTTVPSAETTVPAASSTAVVVTLPATIAPTVAPTVAPTAPPTAPPTAAPTGPSWGGWDPFEVPQLGTEPVRGSGCGATSQLGDTLPDGVWAVNIGDGQGSRQYWTGNQMQVDVICVYYGASAQQQAEQQCAADPGSDWCGSDFSDSGWLVVNNNTRRRTMPVSPSVQYGDPVLGPGAFTTDPNSPDASWPYMWSWIVVQGGVVTTVVSTPMGG